MEVPISHTESNNSQKAYKLSKNQLRDAMSELPLLVIPNKFISKVDE